MTKGNIFNYLLNLIIILYFLDIMHERNTILKISLLTKNHFPKLISIHTYLI